MIRIFGNVSKIGIIFFLLSVTFQELKFATCFARIGQKLGHEAITLNLSNDTMNLFFKQILQALKCKH